MLQPHSYQPPEDGLPPAEIRILDLRAEPWPEDNRKVRIHLHISPFLERPNLEVTITSESGVEAAGIHIIESIDSQMTFTMHLRGIQDERKFTLSASVLYPEIEIVDQKNVEFSIQEPTE